MRHLLWILVFSVTARAASNFSNYYLNSYESSRSAFRAITQSSPFKRNGASGSIPVAQTVEKDLTMDWAYLPAAEPDGLVVILSGVHGAEAYAASAVQRMLMSRVAWDTTKTGFLFIHAVNPFGFKHFRRVNEHNVDLNRNFSRDPKVFAAKNDAYLKLSPILNPERPANASWVNHAKFLFQTLKALLKSSFGALTQAIGQGQYSLPKGIFYGGQAPEEQVALVEALVKQTAEKYRKVLVFDLHTGFGKAGFMHLLPNPPDTKEIEKRYEIVFRPHVVETTANGEFYSNEGDVSTHLSRELEKEGKSTVPMLIEFGTVNSQTYEGSIKTLSRVILENQLFHYGSVDERSAKKIRENYRELFFPSSSDWRQKVMQQSFNEIPQFVRNFSEKL